MCLESFYFNTESVYTSLIYDEMIKTIDRILL